MTGKRGTFHLPTYIDVATTVTKRAGREITGKAILLG